MSTKNLPNTYDYLLPESLAGLHRESVEWMQTVAFWQDETRFFASLLESTKTANPKGVDTSEMLRDLDRLHQMLFEYLAEEIREHENVLSRIEKGAKGVADSRYRETHRSLKEKMTRFTLDFRAFKSLVFSYARDLKTFRA
ncbi:hypothetical protein [Robiginitalea sp.]|uniref:hypothetical protein n=1 Tax=Robiginitalea sp. TaxID=1902411 RepID=UPI003C741E02